MKIELEITDVVGGHKIVAQFSGEQGNPPSFDEAYAPTKRSIPTRAKTLLAKYFKSESKS